MKNSRINVTFDKDIVCLLSDLAGKEHKSVSGLVKDLALEALEKREDFCLSRLAKEIDTPNTPTYSHEDAWK
jgi:hypothetical protein